MYENRLTNEGCCWFQMYERSYASCCKISSEGVFKRKIAIGFDIVEEFDYNISNSEKEVFFEHFIEDFVE